MRHYFIGDNSVYDENDFRRRFRMDSIVFEKIYNAIAGEGIFAQRYDCTNKAGIHPLVRITACLRVLSYGNCVDAYDESFQIAESTLIDSVKTFALTIIEKFGAAYLNRPPTEEELERILVINNNRGFPGLVASWDCKHFVWKNCPVYLAGQYTGKGKVPTVVLEAICDPNLFIYFSFFGLPGSLNDINILDRSTVFSALLSRRFDLKTKEYTINNNVRDWLYFLVDGIYPPWSIF
jgi:Plant transposon protein